jgi:hypothetical protein
MKKMLIVLTLVTLSGCSMLNYIPSSFDYNESAKATDIQQQARALNCQGNSKQSIDTLYYSVKWLEMYSSTKKSRDIASILPSLVKSATELEERSDKGPVSHIYCELKKKILTQEADQISNAVQGRFL